MNDRFDLIDEAWVPVHLKDGTVRELSLSEVFERADDIRAVVGELPTTALAMLRLLLAVVHRAVDGPRDVAEWTELWTAPRLPVDAIADYLQTWRHRFDLLDDTTPFFQVAGLHTAKRELSGLQVLVADVPNNIRMFPTRHGPGLASMSLAEAARWVVHAQAFEPSGIRGAAVGDPRANGGRVYPIGTGWGGQIGGVYVEGESLRETLLLNLGAVQPDDRPVWERAPQDSGPESGEVRMATGPCDAYTWQKARLLLGVDGARVTQALVCNGDAPQLANQQQVEPMTGWYRSKNQEAARKVEPYYLPARHDPNRLFWRGIAALLPRRDVLTTGSGAAQHLAPRVLDWLAELQLSGAVDPRTVIRIHATGMEYGPQSAVVNDIVDDVLLVQLALLRADDRLLAHVVEDAVDQASKACWALGTLAANMMSAEVGDAAGDAGKDRIAAARAAGQLSGYAALDAPFREWLSTLGVDTDPPVARESWRVEVSGVARRLAAELAAQASPQAMTTRPNHPMCVPVAMNQFLGYLRQHEILVEKERSARD